MLCSKKLQLATDAVGSNMSLSALQDTKLFYFTWAKLTKSFLRDDPVAIDAIKQLSSNFSNQHKFSHICLLKIKNKSMIIHNHVN